MSVRTSGFRNLLLGALGVVLAGCSGGDKVQDVPPPPASDVGQIVERTRSEQVAAERRERERQRLAEKAADSRFVYARYAPDTSGEQPRACLVFSRPLDPKIDYSVYVEMDASIAPAFSIEGEQLCLGGLSFASSYDVTLREGLPAADGTELGRQEEVSISFEDRPAFVGFKGAGVILPRQDADGLAIETVNVNQVRVSVSRVNDRALVFKSISQGSETAEGRYAYTYGEENPSDVSTEVWSGTMDIKSISNAPVVTVFPLPTVIGTLEPGAYYVEIADTKEVDPYEGPAASARRWIMLTDLALTAYQSQSGLDVTLRSLQDGRVLQNTNVKLIAFNNEVLGEGMTGVDGRVTFNAELLAGQGNTAPRIVLASGLKGDTAVLELTRAPVDVSELDVGGRVTFGEVDTYVYSDRGIYRPGETVRLTAMLRDRAGRAIAERAGTMITYRPNGMEARRERFLVAASGSLQRDIALPRDAARGLWRTGIELDGLGETGSIAYAVEDFVPQRIAVELTAEQAAFLPGDDARDVDVDARFLYGAPGAGLTVQAQARVEVDPAPFASFKGYQWGRFESSFFEQSLELDDRTTDGSGHAVVAIAPKGLGQDADMPLRLNAVISVLEPGGRAVTESVRIPYRPKDLYLGIKPGFEGRLGYEQAGSFDVAAVSGPGEPVDTALSWKLLAIDYHYDWYRDGESWNWRRSRSVRTVNQGSLETVSGIASVPVTGLDWGAHELIIEGADATAASFSFYVGWGGSVSDSGVEAPDRVLVGFDEQVIVPGRPAVLTIVPPYDGEAQIVVATDRILSIETRQVQASGTQVTLPVSDDWGEGAYVMVNVYTPRDPVIQSRPRRAVGVGYVPVDMTARSFDVSIDAPDLARPGKTQTINVTVAGGPREKAFVTLAAVDEGILRLTGFASPDPKAWYFGKKAMGLSLYDDYGRLLDPNLGLPAEVRSGGDQLGGEGLTVVPTQTVALFSGVVEVGRGGRAEVKFDLPEFNGELRLMAVAWSQTGLGAASQPMTLRDEAPADLILPRFMAPGDQAVATVSIDNIELADGTFEVELEAGAPLSVAAQQLSKTIPKGQRVDQGLSFTAEGSGISTLNLSVKGPGNYAVDRAYSLQTRSPFLPVTTVSRALMEADQTYTPDESLLAGLVPGTEAITVSFSGLPVDANALYTSLDRYPYGCTEQTISRALPLIYAEQLVDQRNDGARPGAKDRVQAAVSRVLNRQSASGEFGLWREGDGQATPWLGAFTTDFLYRAQQAGYEVPQAALERAYTSMRSIGQGDAWRIYGYATDVYESRYHDDTEKKLMLRSAPYALYVLARAGKGDISRLRYLHDRELRNIRSPLAKAQLAAALSYMGDRSRAASAFEAAEKALGYKNSGDYYQTRLRDLSGVLALAEEAGFTDLVARLAEKLGDDTPEPDSLTTQEKAFLLMAVNGLNQEDGLNLNVTGLGSGSNNDRRYFVTAEDVRRGVSFNLRRGSSPVFRTVMVTGSPAKAPPAASRNLSVTKTVRTLQGGRVDLNRVTQGDQMVVSLVLTPKERRNNPVILADLLPAGFEIETVLGPADGDRSDGPDGVFGWLGAIDRAQTAEARDDRFVAAIDVIDQPRTIAYVVRAVTPGTFTMPGVVAEDMYRPEVFARSASATVAIAPLVSGPGGSR